MIVFSLVCYFFAAAALLYWYTDEYGHTVADRLCWSTGVAGMSSMPLMTMLLA